MSASSVLRSLAGEVIDFLVFVGELLGGASADQAREAILRDLGAKPGSGGLVLPAASMDSVKAYRDSIDTDLQADIAAAADIAIVINAIIEQTGVKIDITDDGAVSICGTDAKGMEEAQKMIHIIVTDFEAGQVLEGKVVSIKDFGAFLEFAPGKEGMVHISKLSKERVNRVEDVLTLGDVVKVVCLGKDKMGRISFSMKDVAE